MLKKRGPDGEAALPLPAEQHPELLDPEDRAQRTIESTEMSCADQAMIDDQGIAINAPIAAMAANILSRMLLTRDLRTFASYLDLSASVVHAKYITPETLRRFAYPGQKN